MSEKESQMTDAPIEVGTKAGKRAATKTSRPNVLSQELIVTCAFELAVREGAGALSMRRLGEELGVDATAFYRHFRDKDDLILAVGDRVTAWTLERVREVITPETPWQDVLRAIAKYSWESSVKFPAVYAMTFARTTGQAAEREMVELIISSVARAGLSPERTVLLYRTFGDVSLGLCGSNATIESMDARLQEKDSTAWSRIYAVLPNETFPSTRGHTRELIAVTDSQIYDNAVELLIASIERLADQASRSPSQS